MGNFAENLNLGNRFRPPLSQRMQSKKYKSLEGEFQVEKKKKEKINTWFYMPRFYFGIKNILHHILLNVCVREKKQKQNKERLMKERKAELNFRNHAVKSFFLINYMPLLSGK